MPNTHYSDFFLGANSPTGFRSMFTESYSADEGWQVYIIKGGPGTGKSTLMRRIADLAVEQGVFAQRIHCSSDPDSLDAVILPHLRRAIYDGTAPHVLEPQLPGACERLVDLGQAWDADVLLSRREDIARLSADCSALHRQATQMLACADVFRHRLSHPAALAADRDKLDRAAERLCLRFGLDRKSASHGRITRRLASAVTPRGIMNAAEEYIASFGRVVPVYDSTCAVSGILLSALRDRLTGRGFDIIECPCSQQPDRPEHLLLPEEDICFTVRSDIHGAELCADGDERAIRSGRFLPPEFSRGRHPERVSDRRELLRFTQLAADCMRKAKETHDLLENCYRDAMDFDTVRLMGDRTAERMLG